MIAKTNGKGFEFEIDRDDLKTYFDNFYKELKCIVS